MDSLTFGREGTKIMGHLQNKPTVNIASDPSERMNMEITGDINDEGHVTEAVIDINSEEASSSRTQDTKPNNSPSEPAAIKVPSEGSQIVNAVDRLVSKDSLTQVDQGTSGCSINSSEECVPVNCLKNNSVSDLNKKVSVNENDSAAINISSETSRSVAEDSGEERVCRICHLSSVQSLVTETNEISGNNAASELIQLGCGCKDELGIAHTLCAEAWFKLKGNRLCEICGETAQNISGVWDDRFIDKWNVILSTSSNIDGQPGRGSCWRRQTFCNFLTACLVIAFVLPWFFHVKVF